MIGRVVQPEFVIGDQAFLFEVGVNGLEILPNIFPERMRGKEKITKEVTLEAIQSPPAMKIGFSGRMGLARSGGSAPTRGDVA